MRPHLKPTKERSYFHFVNASYAVLMNDDDDDNNYTSEFVLD